MGRLGVLTPALRSPCSRKRGLLEGLQAGVERVAGTKEGPLCSRRALQARICGPGARLPPSAAPRPPRHVGRGRGRLRVTRPPRGALQPPQQHRAPHGPRRPQSALLLIVRPGKEEDSDHT